MSPWLSSALLSVISPIYYTRVSYERAMQRPSVYEVSKMNPSKYKNIQNHTDERNIRQWNNFRWDSRHCEWFSVMIWIRHQLYASDLPTAKPNYHCILIPPLYLFLDRQLHLWHGRPQVAHCSTSPHPPFYLKSYYHLRQSPSKLQGDRAISLDHWSLGQD